MVVDAPFEIVVVSGLSGSGKTVALHALEDVGFYCVDNLPTPLVPAFLDLAAQDVKRAAVAIDVRERSLSTASEWPRLIEQLAAMRERGDRPTLLFLDCDESELVQRFKASRRPHPLEAQGIAQNLGDAIALEREAVAPFRATATVVVDTTQITVHDLRRRVQTLFGNADRQALALHLVSFGFRNGIPPEADFVFDARYLDNPYFVKELRDASGLDEACAAFVMRQPLAVSLVDHAERLLTEVLPAVEAEGRASLTVAFGCTGGRHRSVALAEALGRRLEGRGLTPLLLHRDVAR